MQAHLSYAVVCLLAYTSLEQVIDTHPILFIHALVNNLISMKSDALIHNNESVSTFEDVLFMNIRVGCNSHHITF